MLETHSMGQLCEMPFRVINFKLKGKKDDAENPIRQRSSHSSPRALTVLTWRRRTGCLIDEKWRYAKCRKLILYYQY